jgi:hypothetical protein
MGKDAVNWLLEFFKASTPGLTLIQVAVTFSVTFMAAKAFCALCERVVFRRPLPWSSHMLSLFIATVFWSSLLFLVLHQLETLSDHLNGKIYPAQSIGFVLASAVLAIPLVSPFSLLIIPILLLCLFYPVCLRSRKTRTVFVYVALMSMVANYGWLLAWNSHSS